ncbi:hypothetical protein I316_04683 [Kwoniella heveanensis BCC8398]|uniref:C2 NT-type domain-containing protein n=1 Tax=Kwoniella heveanensis BCC8398 TaxID=1296120 RepID=A0A1B9GRB1_9TREE|nr:hypothetical protein I316_04683 [Kwoniella heveanensis BCC8398]
MPPTRSSTPGYASSVASSSQTIPPNNNSGFISLNGEGSSSSTAHQQHQQQHQHQSKLAKFKQIFDTQKYAVFETHVTIHELGNVPQLQGEFDVKWKFRGKRPKSKELLEINKNGPLPKPSLPNLKLASQNMHPSSSSASLQSTSTTSSGAYPPTPRSLLTPSGAPTRPSRTLSLPPSRDDLNRPMKKGSDPTPLKQVLQSVTSGESSSTGQGHPTVESPQQLVDEPEGLDGDLHPRDYGEPDSRRSTQSAGIPPLISVHRPSLPISTASSSRNPSGISTPTERLAVPFPRGVPPIRSGTTPSYSTLIDPLPGSDENRRSLNRTISMATTATSRSTSASISAHPKLNRARSASGPGPSRNAPHTDLLSEARKGTTPGRPLRSHSCKWEYELHHVLRIPLGKPLPDTAPNGYSYRQNTKGPPPPSFPVLGTGPHSESGLRLVIEQLPAPGKSSSISTAGADASLESTSAAAQKSNKKDHHPTEAGDRRENREKSVFGVVDVDLAAFAGKGKMTRRFLLRGSRTNATIKLSVDMRWIGGEQNWAAPPMQEGHHVAGVSDLVGNETAEAMRSDLGLVKTPSNSSSGSSLGLERTRTNFSAMSSVYASRNHSAISLGASLPSHQYQSFEHHLLKPEAQPRYQGGSSPMNRNGSGGDEYLSSAPASNHSSPSKHQRGVASSTLSPSPVIMSLSKVHHHHRHHTHHIRGHGRVPSKSGIHDLPPEVIIEAIFNPHPASVEGPFTYVPEGPGHTDLAGEKEVLDQVLKDAGGDEGDNPPEGESPPNEDDGAAGAGSGSGEKGKHRLGWRMRGRARADREKKERRGRQRTDSSGTGTGA